MSRNFEKYKEIKYERGILPLLIITISRQTGSLGDEIARNIASTRGQKLITRKYIMDNWLPEVADEHDLNILKESSKYYNHQAVGDLSYAEYIEQRLRSEVKTNPTVILGLGAQIIFRNNPSAIHIRIISSDNVRRQRISEKYGLDKKQAERTLDLSDRKHRRYVWRVYDKDWANPALYHICLNTDGINIDNTTRLIIHLIDLQKKSPSPLSNNKPESKKQQDIEFVHPSEKKFAKILNMHKIKWKYEPTEFPLKWDAEGNITMGFRPDFFLPEFDTYIELTTMKQKYVTEKNQKVKLLRKLYPDINIKIVYNKDFQKLIERFDHSE